MSVCDRRAANGWRAVLLALGLVAGALVNGGDAQTTRGVMLQSGLHTFPQKHTARLTVVELGDPAAVSRVVIDYRDARDRVLARTVGVLRRGEPVQLDLPMSDVLTQLRATVSIVTAFGVASRPSTTFEDVDVDSLAVVPKVICGPPSSHDSPQAHCPGWEVTHLVQ